MIEDICWVSGSVSMSMCMHTRRNSDICWTLEVCLFQDKHFCIYSTSEFQIKQLKLQQYSLLSAGESDTQFQMT